MAEEIQEQEKKEPKQPSISANVTAGDVAAQYVDYINSEANVNVVYLGLCQKMPSGVGADMRVVARVALSWPMLVKTRDLFNRLIETHRASVLAEYDYLLSPEYKPDMPQDR